MRAEVFRLELTKVLRHQPFEKFLIAFDSGDKVIIEHPENVAFDPTPGSSYHLYVVGGNARRHSSLDGVSTIILLDKLIASNGIHEPVSS